MKKHVLHMKRIISVIVMLTCLTSSLLLPAGATENGVDAAYEAKKAAYREKLMADDVTADDFLIGAWSPIYSTEIHSIEYQLDQMAAAGVNFNIHPYDNWGIRDADFWNEVEEQFGQRNMVYLMYGNQYGDIMESGVAYAEGKEHCIGYYILDEPSGAELDLVGQASRAYAEADADRFPLVNLLPSYAGTERLGGTYREHVENYVAAVGAENIGYLSHDYYAISLGVDTAIYGDLEVLRSVAYENGKLKTHAFPQSFSWKGQSMVNIDQMRWNVYAYLAYGFKALSWFTLVCIQPWNFEDALIYNDGTIHDPELFAAWSELNWEVRGMSSVLMNLDTVHAYHVRANAEGVEKLPTDFFLQPANRNDFIISVMEPKEGDDQYIMIYNKNYRRDVEGSFTVDPASGVKWVEYFDPFTGEYVPVTLENGLLNDSYLVGEGKLYRLRYDEPPVEETEAETEPATEPVTEPATEPVTEPTTDAATDAVTEPATDTEAETKVENLTDAPAVSDPDTDMTEEPASGGCTSALGISAVLLPTVAAAVVLRKRRDE